MKNSKYTIQANIPIPSTRGRKLDPNSFSGKLRALKVGQSVLHPTAKISTITVRASHVMGPGNYTTRKVENGVRVWRIK